MNGTSFGLILEWMRSAKKETHKESSPEKNKPQDDTTQKSDLRRTFNQRENKKNRR